MPTLGSHFSETEAAIVAKAAKASGSEKVSPYIAEAVRQRLEREGFLPGTKEHARREMLAILDQTMSDEQLSALVAGQCAAAAAASAA
jgi:hypothetical protein